MEASKESKEESNHRSRTGKGKTCKGTLYYSSILKSKGRSPRCFGLSDPTQQVPFLVSESEAEASKQGRTLTDFKYACLGYSVFVENKGASAGDQNPRLELPLCIGMELLMDKKPADDHAPAPVPAHVQAHSGEGDSKVSHPHPRPQKPTQPIGAGGEFYTRFTRNANLVASGVARNLRRVGNHIKEAVDDVLYPYRRRPK